MNDEDRTTTPTLVLHLIPEDMARGAQSYARALVDQLDGTRQHHRIATLFASGPSVVNPDMRLDVPMGRLRAAGLHPLVLWRLRRLIRSTRPVTVVAHGGEAAKYAAMVKGSSVPMIYLMIGSAHPRMSRRLSRALYQRVLDSSSLVVTVSKGLAREAEELHGLEPEKILVIPNGRDETVFKPAPSPAATPVRIGWVGHMETAKRPGLFVEVMRVVLGETGEVSGWMAGTGPLLEDVKAKGQALGIDVMGERADIAGLLAASHILVFTGMPPEGLPGVLIEGALCGLPVVTTDVPGASEVVVNGVTGYITALDDTAGLVDSILSLVSDRGLRERMGHAAREWAVDHFSLEKSLEAWRTALARVVPR
jgi:glycosyltransferase involved in cell wall biosynthesis